MKSLSPEIQIPFYSEEASRYAALGPSVRVAGGIVDLLQGEAVGKLVNSNELTLGLIKPIFPQHNTIGMNDAQSAECIERNMIRGLGLLAKFSFTFDREGVNDFYGHPDKPRWDEYVEAMTSGRTTALLLHQSGADAINTWRSQIGERREPTPESIRGQLAIDPIHTLVHASDSPEAVRRELSVIAGCVARVYGEQTPV